MEPTRTSCKSCGATLNFNMEIGGVATCDYCGSVWTLPKRLSDPAALDFLRQGELALDTCKFDEAFTAFQKAKEYDDREPEAYFGMALAKFKVQYLKDETADKPRLQPICHEISEAIFTRNEYFQRAISYATAYQREEYLKKGQEIDNIRSEFFKLKETGLDYDCFICVKVTDDETGRRTTDCDLANDIYYYLRDNGLKPFFSEREIKTRIGSDYEALILYALYLSECMIIVCSDESYLHTKWVKNEYTRFARLIADEEKENDAITFAFTGKPIERLPERSGKIQGVNMQKPDAFPLIAQFVQHHTVEARAAREAEELRKQEQQERLFKQMEEQKRAQKELEERLKNLSSGVNGNAASPTVRSLLVRAGQELVRRDYAESERYCKEVLNIDPENGEAWVRLYLAETWKTMTRRFKFDGRPDGDSVVPEILERLYDKKTSLMNFIDSSLNSQSFINAEIYGKESVAFQTVAEKSSEVLTKIRSALVREQEEIRTQGKATRDEQMKLQKSYRDLLERKEEVKRRTQEASERCGQLERNIQQTKKRVFMLSWTMAALVGFLVAFLFGTLTIDSGAGIGMGIFFGFWSGLISAIVGRVTLYVKNNTKNRKIRRLTLELNESQMQMQRNDREITEIERELDETTQTIDDRIITALRNWEDELQANIAYIDTLDKIYKKLQQYCEEK